MQEVMNLARLRVCAGSHEHLLLANSTRWRSLVQRCYVSISTVSLIRAFTHNTCNVEAYMKAQAKINTAMHIR